MFELQFYENLHLILKLYCQILNNAYHEEIREYHQIWPLASLYIFGGIPIQFLVASFTTWTNGGIQKFQS